MNRAEKEQFIVELLKAMETRLLKRVKHMPEEWDGVELRQLIADAAKNNAIPSLLKNKRLRDYRNTVLVENLL